MCTIIAATLAASLAFSLSQGVGRPFAQRMLQSEVGEGGGDKGNAVQRALGNVQASIDQGSFWQQFSAVLALRMTPVVPFRCWAAPHGISMYMYLAPLLWVFPMLLGGFAWLLCCGFPILRGVLATCRCTTCSTGRGFDVGLPGIVLRSASSYLLGLTPLPFKPFFSGTLVAMALWGPLYASIGAASRALLTNGSDMGELLAGAPSWPACCGMVPHTRGDVLTRGPAVCTDLQARTGAYTEKAAIVGLIAGVVVLVLWSSGLLQRTEQQ